MSNISRRRMVRAQSKADHFPVLRTLTLASFLAFGSVVSIASAQEMVAIVGGTLIDGTGRPPVPNAVLVIERGVIKAAGPANAVTVPSGAHV
ncbi:MAG: hypothetical protein ACRECY_17595, partial [Phyllobacterium sp.]